MNRQDAMKLYGKPRRRRNWGPEAALQYTVVEYLRLMPTDGTWFLHACNEGKRSPAEGAHLKRMGMLPGAADLMIVTPQGTVWLELKSKGEKPTPEQLAFKELVLSTGHDWNWADNIGDALELLRRWGALKSEAEFRRAA